MQKLFKIICPYHHLFVKICPMAIIGRTKMQVRKNEVGMLAEASTDGAITITEVTVL